jgi:hypothetical protein
VSNIPLDHRLAELADADRDVAPPLDLETRTLVAWETWRRNHDGFSSDRPAASSRVPIRVIAALAGLAAAVLLGLAIPRDTPGARPLDPDRDRDSQARDAVSHEAAIVPPGRVAEFRAGAPVAPPGTTSRVGSPTGQVSSAGYAGNATSASPERPRGKDERFNTVAGDRLVRHVDPDGDSHRVTRESGVHRRAPQPLEPFSHPGAIAAPANVETTSFVPLGPDVERELTGAFQLARIRLSRDELADLGLFLDPHRGDEAVQADVVFGEDGLARAIRLAPVSTISGRIR